MDDNKYFSGNLDEFTKLVNDLENLEVTIDDKDQAMLVYLFAKTI